MCRWLAYTGSPLLLERALYAPAHSLIDQSLSSTLGAEPTNGDGFGVGWYDDQPTPGVFRSIKYPFQGTIATTDGEHMWAFRYSSEGKSRSLFFTGHVPTLRKLYPEREVLFEMSDDARLVVSEPMGDLPGAWNEVPESSYGVVGHGDDQLRHFEVKAPPKAVATTA